jgi:hypothetical protein
MVQTAKYGPLNLKAGRLIAVAKTAATTQPTIMPNHGDKLYQRSRRVEA